MLPASMNATRLRNMSVNMPAGMFIAPIAAARTPMMPPRGDVAQQQRLLDVREQQQQRLLVEVLDAVPRRQSDHEPHVLRRARRGRRRLRGLLDGGGGAFGRSHGG